MNKPTYILIIFLAFIINACTPNAINIFPNVVKVDDVLEISCSELGHSKSLYLKRVRKYWILQDNVAMMDKVVIGVTFASFFILAPLLFILSKDDYSKELANAKGKYLAIEEAYAMKNCE